MLEYHELSSLSRATRPSGEEPGLGFLRVFMFASRDSAEVMEIDNRIESCYIDKMKSTSEAMSNKTGEANPGPSGSHWRITIITHHGMSSTNPTLSEAWQRRSATNALK